MPKKMKRTAENFKQRVRSLELVCRATPQVDGIDDEKKMIPFTLISDNNTGLRYDWWEDEFFTEELDVNGANFEDLETLFRDHLLNTYTASARFENKRIEDGKFKADAYFSSDEDSQVLYTKYKERILSSISVGYWIREFVETVKEDEPNHILVTKFDIYEASAVWRGFEKGAKAGRSKERLPAVENKEVDPDWESEYRERKLKLNGRKV